MTFVIAISTIVSVILCALSLFGCPSFDDLSCGLSFKPWKRALPVQLLQQLIKENDADRSGTINMMEAREFDLRSTGGLHP